MTVPVAPADVESVRRRAERLHAPAEIEAALDSLATQLAARAGGANPLLLGVMIGGVVPLGLLLPRLDFPLQVDYLHATRYRGTTTGGEVRWLRMPTTPLAGRTVVVVDDVLDEGITLAAIIERLRAEGAAQVLTVVLVEKRLARPRPLAHADFAALHADDRYLFGYGMDYHGYLRNAPGIFAVAAGAA